LSIMSRVRRAGGPWGGTQRNGLPPENPRAKNRVVDPHPRPRHPRAWTPVDAAQHGLKADLALVPLLAPRLGPHSHNSGRLAEIEKLLGRASHEQMHHPGDDAGPACLVAGRRTRDTPCPASKRDPDVREPWATRTDTLPGLVPWATCTTTSMPSQTVTSQERTSVPRPSTAKAPQIRRSISGKTHGPRKRRDENGTVSLGAAARLT
jgi:hypothetical protein